MTARRIFCAMAMLLAFAVAPAYAKPLKRNSESTIMGGRPAGCPYRFCGCALSIRVFGTIKPVLNLAANWRQLFPRTRPAPAMVAARAGHVFLLLDHVDGDTWRVWDANSGGGKIRVHHRSIAGYTIVNPHAAAVASLNLVSASSGAVHRSVAD